MKPKYRIKRICHNNPMLDYYVVERTYFKLYWTIVDSTGEVSPYRWFCRYSSPEEAAEAIKIFIGKVQIKEEIICPE